jgi:hypothetical protein
MCVSILTNLTSARNNPLPSSHYKTSTISKLQKTPLEYTRFINGCFMDYFGSPHAPTYLPMFAIGIDVENAVAAIPGDGDVRIAFTYSRDIGDFVAAALELDVWPEASFMAGDKISFNEMLTIAEKTRGMYIVHSCVPKQSQLSNLQVSSFKSSMIPSQNCEAEKTPNFRQMSLNMLSFRESNLIQLFRGLS